VPEVYSTKPAVEEIGMALRQTYLSMKKRLPKDAEAVLVMRERERRAGSIEGAARRVQAPGSGVRENGEGLDRSRLVRL
jgi:hypothetical protein